MGSARHDSSTVGLSGAGQRPLADGGASCEPVPALTVLFHPEARRIGARALLGEIVRGQEARLSRLEPELAQPGSPPLGSLGEPLDDLHLSRRPIHLLPLPGGGIELRLGDSRTRVAIGGQAVHESQELGAAEIRDGVVLELAERVVLLLHRVAPPPPAAAEVCGLVGDSSEIARVRADIRLAADLAVPVLIRGETGTGKELAARALHEAGPRRRGPFVSVNLGAIAPSLAASELFGATRGAFTGAVQAQDGYFRRAHGGTLLLDEIGETPEEVQTALLRALETGEIQPVGAQSPQRVDVRVVAATDADLERRVAAGTFRGPLLHRLSGYSLWLPPLRERRDDVGRLLVHFLRQELEALGEPFPLDTAPASGLLWLPPALVARLARYDWPGNVRQLRNAVRQLVIGNRGLPQLRPGPGFERLLAETRDGEPAPLAHAGAAALPAGGPAVPPGAAPGVTPAAAPGAPPAEADPARRGRRRPSEVSAEELLAALAANRWSLKGTAEELGISRPSLYALIDHCPEIRKAGDLPSEEIARCHADCHGDLDAMVERLRVSRNALHRRVRELGLT